MKPNYWARWRSKEDCRKLSRIANDLYQRGCLGECDLARIWKSISKVVLQLPWFATRGEGSPFTWVGYDASNSVYRISEIDAPNVDEYELSYSAYTGIQIVNQNS